MAVNEILPFAQDPAALVLTQAAYAADVQRPVGHQVGVARADFANKVERQCSVIAAGVAQFLADNQATNITDLLTAAALSTIITNAIKAVTLMPAGSIIWVPGITPPAGTVKVNGALLNRAAYARLWTFAQVAGNVTTDVNWPNSPGIFSFGDGSTNFRLPDLRGYSLRAWDDGRGIDPGRLAATVQADQNLSHVHAVTDPLHQHTYGDPSHTHSANVTDPGHIHGVPHDTSSATSGAAISGASSTNTTQVTTSSTTGITVSLTAANTGITINYATTGVSIVAAGGTEVRVKNIAMMPVMFY